MVPLDILEDVVRIDIDEIIIDFFIKFDITGKIHSIKPLIDDLPANAQKLILGKDAEKKRDNIEALKNLMPLIIPLGIVNQNNFFTKELSTLNKKIFDYLKKRNLSLNNIIQFTEPQSIQFYIFSSHLEASNHPNDFNLMWKKVISLIENRDGIINNENLRHLGSYYPQFGFKIIPLLMPYLKTIDNKRTAYEYIGYYQSDATRDFLSEAMKNCIEDQILSGIFKGLAKQKLENTNIQEEIIKIYNSKINLGETTKANLMEVLKQFPNDETSKIGLEIINENNRYTGNIASRILLGNRVPPEKIAEIILPKLRTCDPRISESAFNILCNSNKFKSCIPSSDKLLNIYVKTLEVNMNLNIAYCMPSIVRKYGEINISEKIVKLLSHPNPNVLEGILILLKSLLRDDKFDKFDIDNLNSLNVNSSKNHMTINTKPFYSKNAKKQYYNLLQHENKKVVEYAIGTVQTIAFQQQDATWIDIILDLINFEIEDTTNLHAMRAINQILPAVKFNERIVNIFKIAIKNPNSNYRCEALKGLRYCEDNNLKKTLAYLVDDPSKEVSNEAKNLHLPPYRIPRKPSHFNQLIKKILNIFKKKDDNLSKQDMEFFAKHLSDVMRIANNEKSKKENHILK